jgi:outer membrane receptor for Fe3+-dicitrate
MKTLFTTIILLFFYTVLHAHTGSLRGIVYDGNTHKPAEGVNIFIARGNHSAVTDAFGKFFIKGMEPGRYKITISHVGYNNVEDEVTVKDGETTDATFKLEKAPIQMDAVSVNARKPLTMSSVSGLDLKLRPVNSTQDMLRLVPGLFIAQHQGGGKAEQIFMRGFDCDHGTDINISVDGVPVNMVSHAHGQGFADAHFIIPEAVQEVDYGKGPYEIDKGNLATAGFVAFKTKNELDNSFVKAEGGMYNYFRTVAGLQLLTRGHDSNAHQEAYVMGEYGYNRSYFDMPQNFNRFNLMGKYTNYIASNKILTLTLSGMHSFWDASGQLPTRAVDMGLVSRYGSLDPEGGITSRYNMNLQYFQGIGNNAYFKSNLYLTYYQFKLYSDFTYFLVNPDKGDLIKQAESRILAGYNSEYGNSYTLAGLKMKTHLGLGIRYDNITGAELSYMTTRSIVNEQLAFGDVHEANISGYVNQSIYLLPQLVLHVGTRYDALVQQYEDRRAISVDKPRYMSTGGKFSPKAGVYYNIADKARIYYNYGTGFHSNDARTLATGVQLNGAIKVNDIMPLAFSHDLGLVIKPYRKLLVSAAVWRMDMEQEFSYVGDVAQIDTGGRTRRYGVDVSVRYQVLKWLYADVDVNYAHGRYLDQPKGQDYIALAPPFTSIGGLTFMLNKNLSASLRYRHMGDRPANDDNSRKAIGYTVFDGVVNYIRPHYEFGLQIQNLTNTQWNEAQFDTETRLRLANGMLEASPQADVCYTPGTPFFLKLSATYKF